MRLAHRIDDYGETNVSEFVTALAARDFGPMHAQEISDLVMQYFQINIARRPEFMKKGVYNLVNYGAVDASDRDIGGIARREEGRLLRDGAVPPARE